MELRLDGKVHVVLARQLVELDAPRIELARYAAPQVVYFGLHLPIVALGLVDLIAQLLFQFIERGVVR